MGGNGGHAEDTDHDLEHAGREVGEAFAASVTPASEDEEKLLEDDA